MMNEMMRFIGGMKVGKNYNRRRVMIVMGGLCCMVGWMTHQIIQLSTRPKRSRLMELRQEYLKRQRSLPQMLSDMKLESLKDVSSDSTEGGIPFFWVVPKSGTSSIKSILIKCLNLRVATSNSQIKYDDYPDELKVVENNYVNVNFGFLDGIEKASRLHMAESGLVDVAVTSYFHPAINDVFTTDHSGRMFAMFRHPVQRLVSDFYYQQIASWEATYDERIQSMTLLEYATEHHTDNWMVRMLANVHGKHVTANDLHFAKHVIKNKCLVLLMEEFDESVDRLLTYMNWQAHIDPSHIDPVTNDNKCLDAFEHRTPSNKNEHPDIEPGSEEWETLKGKNEYDIILYHYAKSLFENEQKELIDTLKSQQQ